MAISGMVPAKSSHSPLYSGAALVSAPLPIQQFLTNAAAQLIGLHPYRYQETVEQLLQQAAAVLGAQQVALIQVREGIVQRTFYAYPQAKSADVSHEQQTCKWWLSRHDSRAVQIWQAKHISLPSLEERLREEGVQWGVSVAVQAEGELLQGFLRIEMAGGADVAKTAVILASGLVSIFVRLLNHIETQRKQVALQTGYHLLRSKLEKETLAAGIINQLNHLLGYTQVHIYFASRTSEHEVALIPFHQTNAAMGSQELPTFLLTDSTNNLILQTAVRGETIVQNGRSQIQQYPPIPLQATSQSAIGIPLIANKSLQGVVQIQHLVRNKFTPNEVESLEIIADQLANMLLHAEQKQQAQHLQKERDVLVAVAQLCAAPLSDDQLIGDVTAVVHEQMQYDSFGIWLVASQTLGHLKRHMTFRSMPSTTTANSIIAPGEGLEHRVRQTGKPLRIADVQKEPAYIPQNPFTLSKLCVPIRVKDEIVALLDAESSRLHAFSVEDESFLVAIAKLLAIAFEQLQFVQQANQYQQEQNTLLETSEKIVAHQSKETLLRIFAEQIKTVLKAQSSRIYLINDDGTNLNCIVTTGMYSSLSQFPAIPVGSGKIGRVAHHQQPQLLRSPKDIGNNQTQAVSQLLAPISNQGHNIGVLVAERTRKQAYFGENDLRLLVAVTNQAAMTLHNQQLIGAQQQLEQFLVALGKMMELTALNDRPEGIASQVAKIVNEKPFSNNGRFSVFLFDKQQSTFEIFNGGSQVLSAISPSQTPAARVLETGKAHLVKEGQFQTAAGGEGKTAVYQPVSTPFQFQAIIGVEFEQSYSWSEIDTQQLATIAQQLSVLFEQCWQRSLYQTSIILQESLVRLSQELMTTTSLFTIGQQTRRFLAEMLPTAQTAVYLTAGSEMQPAWLYDSPLAAKLQQLLLTSKHGWRLKDLLQKDQTRRINNIANSTLDKNLRQLLIESDIQQLMLFPLSSETAVPHGVLIVSRQGTDGAAELTNAAALALTQVLSKAISQQQAQREMQANQKQTKLLNEVSTTLIELTDIPTILATVIQLAAQIVEADSGIVGILIDQQVLTFYPYNLPPSINLQPSSRQPDLDWHVIDTFESMIIPEYSDHPLVKKDDWRQEKMHGALVVPIEEEIEALGILKLFRRTQERPFTQNDLTLIQTVSRQAGTAIQNSRLRTEFLQRIEQLSNALAKQEQLDQKRSRFVQNVSHELRTPLGIIMGYAELLENGGLGQLAAEQQEPITIIVRRVRMLNQLINDLSTLLAAETQEFRRDPVSPTQLIQAMLVEFQIKAQEADITLDADITVKLPWIMGDVNHLRRVFDNLMSNALKFTSAGGIISLRAWTEAYDVFIELSDSGVGISPANLDRIFERFYLVDGGKHAPKSAGTGLGLSLVKEIVDAHHGEVVVSSELGVGTTFQIRFPGYDWDGKE